MSVSAIHIVDLLGKSLISRNYRHSHESDVIDMFMPTVMSTGEMSAAPVLQVGDITFAYVRTNNVYVVATVSSNANISLVFTFLYKALNVMKEYFRDVREESIRDNFVLLYEILDEILDFGYPQITESNILKEYITQESRKLGTPNVPDAVTNAVSWRSGGIVYKRNEVFLDVVESVCLTAKYNGAVISSEIHGSIKITSKLSGMPELHLGINDRLLRDKESTENGKYVDLDELKFHQSVRLTKFDQDRTITFVPPDGEFELMSYRINTYVRPPVWVDCVTRLSRQRVEYTVKVTSHFKNRRSASFVHILIPVPGDVDSPKFQFGVGTVSYVPESNVIKWSIKNLEGCKEYFMIAQFGLPSVPSLDKETSRPIEVKFEISAYSISGLSVRYLKVTEKSGYQAVPWVKYFTKSGEYHIRPRDPVSVKGSS
ncbi:AP-1 complex subunit mu-1-like [Macrosteles quadrilineatus]|uniref:AP-1 complex subunit mu-1-like n=1 Tax=Macrosteles quadrilineatus TaxID=74068 RepID=UPI0023E0C45F|nr:AP-1 complex subunit mu-1-like [Macrosteles quadrilineatus]